MIVFWIVFVITLVALLTGVPRKHLGTIMLTIGIVALLAGHAFT